MSDTPPANNLAALITARLSPLNPLNLELFDESGNHIGHAGNTGGGHFALTLVSAQFVGLSRIARHRLVYAPLADLIPTQIHALSIAAYAPDEI